MPILAVLLPPAAMNVLMLSPGFPDDMPFFARGLAEVGAHVIGVGDQPARALPDTTRRALADYLHVSSLWNEDQVIRELRDFLRGRRIDRVECLWEPGMMLAARLRQLLGCPGLEPEQTHAFRDKVRMKEVLDAAGVRTPRHARARTRDEVRRAAERIGFPMIVKPVDGAGAADTFRLDSGDELERAVDALKHVAEVSCEEFIEGEEYTFDTVCADGRILFENVAWYRPKPLVARQNPWISPQAVAIRDLDRPEIAAGRALGRRVLEVLGFRSGFAHMEWFRTPAGEAVFGEIGGRSPGGRLTHVMNYANDCDLFRGWASAVCHGDLGQPVDRRYNAAVIFKRASGSGTIQRHDGLDALLAEYGRHVAHIDLVPVGQPRRDYTQVVTGDGWIVVRHPDLTTTLEIADKFATDLRIFAA